MWYSDNSVSNAEQLIHQCTIPMKLKATPNSIVSMVLIPSNNSNVLNTFSLVSTNCKEQATQRNVFDVNISVYIFNITTHTHVYARTYIRHIDIGSKDFFCKTFFSNLRHVIPFNRIYKEKRWQRWIRVFKYICKIVCPPPATHTLKPAYEL